MDSLWGYGQLLRRGSAEVAAVTPLLRDPDSEVRAQTAKVLGDAAAAGAAVESSGLAPLLADPSPRARLQAAIALGKLRDPAVVDALFALAERDGAEQHFGEAEIERLGTMVDAARERGVQLARWPALVPLARAWDGSVNRLGLHRLQGHVCLTLRKAARAS